VLLEQRKAEFRNAQILKEWLKERERMKIELGIELRGDLTVEEENFLRTEIEDRLEQTKVLQKYGFTAYISLYTVCNSHRLTCAVEHLKKVLRNCSQWKKHSQN
jgi:hypothetical protein